MSEAASTRSSLLDRSRRPFLLRKLHSLSGVLPVGVFLLAHLWAQATALQGQERYDEAVAGSSHLPFAPLVELLVVLLPLAFHALYGVKLALDGRPNLQRYPRSRNWRYVLQRVSGLVAFAFLGLHVWEYWLQRQLDRLTPLELYPTLCANLSSTVRGVPVVALVYLAGLAAAVFHFANGLWGFGCSWGLTATLRAQRRSATVFGVVGVALFLVGASTTLYFATGSRFSFSGHLFGSVGAQTVRSCAEILVR